MRSRGWLRGAELMEEWFKRPANNDPKNGFPNTSAIKMQWVLSFSRAADVYYNEIINKKIWINKAAQEVIIDLLKIQGCLVPYPGSVRDFGTIDLGVCISPKAMQDLDKYHIQFRSMKQNPLTAPMDDLTAALANFNFNIIVKGKVRCLERLRSSVKTKYEITLSQIGVYVKDSYDFNDGKKSWMSQPLGFWNCENNYAGKFYFNGYYIKNSDFRDWRSKHGKGRGGDYLVFSDILATNVSDYFEFVV